MDGEGGISASAEDDAARIAISTGSNGTMSRVALPASAAIVLGTNTTANELNN